MTWLFITLLETKNVTLFDDNIQEFTREFINSQFTSELADLPAQIRSLWAYL